MRLLFDQKRSWRLVPRLADLFPASAHVGDFEMDDADDRDIWSLAREKGYVIASKDDDFGDEGTHPGPPPKVIRVHVGNGPTQAVEDIIRGSLQDIFVFEKDDKRSLEIG